MRDEYSPNRIAKGLSPYAKYRVDPLSAIRSEENLPNDPTVEVTLVAVIVEAVIWLAVVVPEMSKVATCSAPRVAPDGEN
jgi:hypothetical protein